MPFPVSPSHTLNKPAENAKIGANIPMESVVAGSPGPSMNIQLAMAINMEPNNKNIPATTVASF